ncbi:MAG: chemotaxis protein CheA, partial [Marinilabiliales bacterium]
CIIKPKYKELHYLNEIDPEICYFSWDVILATESDLNEINEVFIFVEDDSEIHIEIISELDLFSDADIKQKITEPFTQNLQDKKGIIRLINLYEKNFKPSSSSHDNQRENVDTVGVTNSKAGDKTEERIEEVEKKDKNIYIQSSNIESVRIPSKKLDILINLVSEFVTNQARLFNYASNHSDGELLELSEDFQNLARQFRDVAFDMRLIPIDSLLVKFKRLIRDLSKQLNKKVNFTTEGTDTELDKNIISAISDPIMHIIRNCMDHGIELAEERIKNQKPEIGNIKLSSHQSGSLILISIIDDGAGIDEEVLLKKAIEKKIVKSGTKLSKEEIISLIMHPGFSTSEKVSNVSGRGVGMDVVKKNVESLRGDIEIKSEKGKGTEIIIKLPLSLSIIDGLLTGVNGSYYLFPLSSVKKIFSIENQQIKSTYKNLIQVEGTQYPFINLSKEFNGESEHNNSKSMLLTEFKDHEVGIIVDEVFSEYQAVLKPIDKILKKNNIFSGASILGDGRLAMVMDVHILINHFSN